MQFKRAKNRIQVWAYQGYNKEKKRAEVKMLGSLDAYSLEPSDGLVESMTDEQKEELQSYIETERQSSSEKLRLYSIKNIHSSIDTVTDSLASNPDDMSPEVADRLYASIDALVRAMRKAGHKRPARSPVAAPVSDERQLPLDSDS